MVIGYLLINVIKALMLAFSYSHTSIVAKKMRVVSLIRQGNNGNFCLYVLFIATLPTQAMF